MVPDSSLSKPIMACYSRGQLWTVTAPIWRLIHLFFRWHANMDHLDHGKKNFQLQRWRIRFLSSISVFEVISHVYSSLPEIKLFIAHIATAGKWYLRKMPILVAHFVFDDSAIVVFKRRFSNCNGALVSRKIRSDGCWSNMFPCVSGRVVVDYDEFG